MSADKQRILVIKHSALGDFIQAMGPFAAIRAHHPAARITLLTTKPFVALAQACPYFDDVWTDSRPKVWEVAALMKLRRMLRSVKFDMVYDLQTSDRSSTYFHLMGDPPWSGIAHGCAYPHDNPDRDKMHTLDRQAEQLAMAGISPTPPPDLSWLRADLTRFNLPLRYALLVPGGAAHRPAKRWPSDRFAALGTQLSAQGITPVLLGTHMDGDAIRVITGNCPTALSLATRTDFADITELARHALAAVGNDTGPMHLIAAAGCPSLVLFSAESDPALCAPRGAVGVLQAEDLAQMPLERVAEALRQRMAPLHG